MKNKLFSLFPQGIYAKDITLPLKSNLLNQPQNEPTLKRVDFHNMLSVLRMQDSLRKEGVKSDHRELRKHPNVSFELSF